MAQQKKVTVELPPGLTLTDEQRESLRKLISVQLAGIHAASHSDDPPPLVETNITLRRPRAGAAKRAGAKEAGSKPYKK